MPMLPIVLSRGGQLVQAVGLLDTGAGVSVLPYSLGERLGFVWEEENAEVVLTGNLARFPARGIVVSASVAHFAPVPLVFAWTQADDVRLLLGQMNFFLEFGVCFFRARSEFEIQRASDK